MAPPKSWDPRDLAIDPGAPIDPLAAPDAPLPPSSPQPDPSRPAPVRPRQPPGRAGALRPLLILGGAAVVAIAIIGYRELRPSTVHILNGFDFEVRVSTLEEGDDGVVHVVPGRGRIEHSISGPVNVRVSTTDDTVLSEETIDVPRGHDLVAYNVLGAAAVYLEEVIYTTSVTGATSRPPALEQFAGQTFISRESVEYVFEAPDEEISLNTSDDEASRWHFDYIGDGGWDAAVNAMIASNQREPARRVLEAVLREDPQNAVALGYQAYLAGANVPQPPALRPPGQLPYNPQTPAAQVPGVQPVGLQPPALPPGQPPVGTRPLVGPANPALAPTPPVQPLGSPPK